MSYEKYYPNGWQSGESGGTPITPEALNHIENGIQTAYESFAPVGYGYGGVIPDPIEIESDDALKAALDGLLADMPNFSARQIRVMHSGPQVVNGTVGMGRQGMLYGSLYKHGNNYAVMRVSGYTGANFQLVKLDTWGEVEWLNPPMVLGAEYRTTERFDGKAVYTRLVNCGIAAHNASITIPGVTRCVRYIGYISYPHESYPIKPLPAWSGDTIGAGYHAEVTQPINPYADGQFIIKTDSNADGIGGGGYTWFVQAWYTKD